LARGFELYQDPDGFETKGDRQALYVEEFLESIDGEPFFLFVNFFDPHAMFQAPESFEARFDVADLRARLAGVEGWEGISKGDSAGWRRVITGEIPPTPAAIDYLKAAYQAEVAFMDHQIGTIISSLEERGLLEDATIILVADHGEFLGEGGFFSHGCRLDPELTEIPLIIKWPGQTKPERDDRLVSQVDLFGTVLTALGIEGSSRDGIPLARDNREAFDARATVFMEEHENRVHPLFENMAISAHLYGLQQLDWRQLVWNGGSLCADRSGEGWSASDCQVDWETRLEELAAVAALPTDHGPSMGESGLTEEMREHLEALGYIQ
jgi:arylsulfatase A-like enzyme